MKKTDIVDAAFKTWGRNFYQKTSLTQLAKELGVSKPALYRHFSSKKALNDAMMERFFDSFADSIRAGYELATQTKDTGEGIFIMLRAVAGFYGRNVYAFVFSLINLSGWSLPGQKTQEQLKSRGVDTETLHQIIQKKYEADSVIMQMILTTLTFFMAQFHKAQKSLENHPGENEIQKISFAICEIVEQGLGFTTDEINLNFEELEKKCEGMTPGTAEPLYLAIGEAVAKAGPWETSMDMVAQRLGLSKSSLYGHFKNRKDMIRRFFLGEFKKIIAFARQGLSLSVIPAEQLYLGIFSIAVYFRCRPELLAAVGWLRTRKLDLGKSEKQEEIFRLFEDVDFEATRNRREGEKRRISYWILFLLIKVLTRPDRDENNNDIRTLYRFITLGLKGFIR